MPSNLAWDDQAINGQPKTEHLQPYRSHAGEMLFDLQADPYELNNLADSPQHQKTLARLQTALNAHLSETRDIGLFPPSTRQDGGLYAWTQKNKYPLDELLAAAKVVATPTPQSAAKLNGYQQSEKPEIRFWGASGWASLAVLFTGQKPSDELLKAIDDNDPYFAAKAAHALCHLGRSDIGAAFLVKAFVCNSKAAFSALETLALTPS